MKQIFYVSSEELCLSIDVTSDHVLGNHVVLLDLVDRFALPEFLHLVRKSLLLYSPVVLVNGLLLALLVLDVNFSLVQKVDPLELELSLISASHADPVFCLCDVEWRAYGKPFFF